MLSRKKWIDCMSHEEKCINCLRKADIGRPCRNINTWWKDKKKSKTFL